MIRKSLVVALGFAFTMGLASGAHAQVFSPELRTQGFGPDLQIQGGVGLGLDRAIDNNFLGRVRLGGLYAYEPWIANLGLTLEIGGLAGLGAGAEAELNSFGGAFGQLGVARVEGDAWLTHLALGFTIFGAEWQHRFARGQDDDALLFCVRVPLGLWWFLVRHDDDEDERMKARAARLRAEPPAQAQSADPAVSTRASADDSYRAQKAIERAREEAEKGNHALAAEAYARAYQLDPDPALLLLLADEELLQNALVSASRDLARFLELTRDTHDERLAAQRAGVQAKLDELGSRIPQVRLVFAVAPESDTQVELDGQPALGAVLGYDIAVDPGSHELVVRRGATLLLQQTFRAQERELVRIDVDANAAKAPGALPPPAAGESSEPRHE